MCAAERQPNFWARSFTVRCNGEKVNYTEIVPHDITSVENHYALCTDYYKRREWERMGTALRESTALTKLHLEGLTGKAVEELFGEGGQWPSLQSLALTDGEFGLAGLRTILPVLDPLPSLETLDLCSCNLGVNAAKLLAGALDRTEINSLLLCDNKITDDGLGRILSAQYARNLIKLYLGKNKLTGRGFEVLSRFLARGGTQLRVLTVDVCQERDRRSHNENNKEEQGRRQTLLLRSIPSSSKLTTVELDGPRLTSSDQDYLFNLICDTSSVESLVNSNHRLSSFQRRFSSDGRRNIALLINRKRNEGGSDANAIRRKLQEFYFMNPRFDVRYFNDMDVVYMPCVLGLVQTCSSPATNKIDSTYRLLRNCHVSELFSFPGPKSVATLLWEKDERIKQLEAENNHLKQEIEELRRSSSIRPNKRAKTSSAL